jgi:hypothetical protein
MWISFFLTADGRGWEQLAGGTPALPGAEHFAVDALCIPAIEAPIRFREKLTVMFSAEAA